MSRRIFATHTLKTALTPLTISVLYGRSLIDITSQKRGSTALHFTMSGYTFVPGQEPPKDMPPPPYHFSEAHGNDEPPPYSAVPSIYEVSPPSSPVPSSSGLSSLTEICPPTLAVPASYCLASLHASRSVPANRTLLTQQVPSTLKHENRSFIEVLQ